MIASARHDYVFASVQKAGSLSFRQWLLEHYAGERVGIYHLFDVPAEHAGRFKFVSVRHPYERLYSLYRFLLHRNAEGIVPPVEHRAAWSAAQNSFGELVKLYKAQGFSQAEIFDRVRADAFVRLEHRREDIPRVLLFHDASKPWPGHARKTPGKGAARFFDQFSRDGAEAELVCKLYAEDFRRFGYTP